LRDRTATSEDVIYQVYQDIDIGVVNEENYVDSIISPTSNPLYKDTISPTNNPLEDTLPPSYSPTTAMPTYYPTQTWDGIIVEPADNNPYFFGSELIEIPELGIEISKDLSVKLIAKTGQRVTFANGTKSSYRWHKRSDGAGIVPLNTTHPLEGGYVYLSNSEDKKGGVYGLFMDKHGNVTDYKPLLTGTRRNCGGGHTPWHTWISCEEEYGGQCWQIDPVNERAEMSKLGGYEGGKFESVAVDPRDRESPVFYVTEDRSGGALRRFIANGSDFEALDTDGEITYLNIKDEYRFEWTANKFIGQLSAKESFPNSEGIQYHDGKLSFMSKRTRKLITLDLDDYTYTEEVVGKKFYGQGYFSRAWGQPDQNLIGPTRKVHYFTEDGALQNGIYARYNDGTYTTMFQAIKGGIHKWDETIGIALSLDNTKFYAGFQSLGYIFEIMRDDGLPFE